MPFTSCFHECSPLPNSCVTAQDLLNPVHPVCWAWCPSLSKWCKPAILAHTAGLVNRLRAGSLDPAILDWREQGEGSAFFFFFCPKASISSSFYQKRPSFGGFYGACRSLNKLVLCSTSDYRSLYMTWPRTHGAAGMSGRIYSHPKS